MADADHPCAFLPRAARRVSHRHRAPWQSILRPPAVRARPLARLPQRTAPREAMRAALTQELAPLFAQARLAAAMAWVAAAGPAFRRWPPKSAMRRDKAPAPASRWRGSAPPTSAAPAASLRCCPVWAVAG